MARVQSRRTISFNVELFEIIHTEAARTGKSAAQLVSEIVREKLGAKYELPAQAFAGPPIAGRTNHMGSERMPGGALAVAAVQIEARNRRG